jgi:hypothetical protein
LRLLIFQNSITAGTYITYDVLQDALGFSRRCS